MENKTAIELLERKLNERITLLDEQHRLNKHERAYIERSNELRLILGTMLNPLKPTEKQQIVDAYKTGYTEKEYLDYYPDKHADDYYKETFNK